VHLVNFPQLQIPSQLFLSIERLRTGQELVGLKNRVNVSFRVPGTEKFAHNLPFLSIQLYYNGMRLTLLEDYTLSESEGSGTGFDTILLGFAPRANDRLVADYVIDTA
jgi:hypothetical protein